MGGTGDPKIPDRASAAMNASVVPVDASTPPELHPELAPELHPEFQPLRRASSRQRAALFIIGPALWVVAAVLIALVVHRTEAVGIALIVLAATLLVALVALLGMRAQRVRAEREA
jgi:hypothetical protein